MDIRLIWERLYWALVKRFLKKIVLVLTNRYSVKQPFVEISCQEIHIFIACLIHQIEQAGLNRLTIVFLSHLILLLFQDNFSMC